MALKGFEKLQRELDQLAKAAKALDGEIVELRYDPNDQDSVETAISEMKQAVNVRVAAYRGNKMVDKLVGEVIAKYEQEILARAAETQVNRDQGDMAVGTGEIDQGVLRQIENTVADLRRAESNTFERHIKKLARLIHSGPLSEISEDLSKGVDLDAWIAEGLETESSMVGSATLSWPESPADELGIVIKLVERFANKPDEAMNFSHQFYYAGNNISRNLQNMVAQMLVPFARDYINHVKVQTGTIEATVLPAPTGPAARKVFIVHGREEGPREAVARFLERLQFDAIILHERANQGRTVIEKIEAHGDVGFAVVLLTPDDEGNFRGEPSRPRPRQNVLLELGYFIGRLGRSRVCALMCGDQEVPSDFGGVVYETYDAGRGWQQALARELKAAGFEIDWNIVMAR